ncbi:sporulation initiation phosphotransferase B [Sporolactobacillus shoreicorticis]|uniref:Spo0B domain-containing protein n=1 Tax=Sporolactobacillus shoreicorticis TaxID=1923877 RepID=A0ABW5S5P2_9BACL|nr:Spo0B domain-containing protein [Sporolactobacillus shoreicorticis]MCO7126420.1 sporulation initiation phosphotransferase B [Sporolactobacillus shoreicorticis]
MRKQKMASAASFCPDNNARNLELRAKKTVYWQRTKEMYFCKALYTIRLIASVILEYIDDWERMEIMFNAEKSIELLNSARHEYLNDLQLIKGYLFLNRTQKVEQVIDKMTEKLNNQSRLAHLQIPECAVFLMQFRWSSHAFALTFEIDGPERDLSAYDKELLNVFQEYFTILEHYSAPIVDNTVRVVIETGSVLCVDLYFEGEMVDRDAAAEQLNKLNVNHSFQWVEHYKLNNECDTR